MLIEQSKCTGCMACYNVCHTRSIQLVEVEDSLHLYPKVNLNTCVNCGQCERVCAPLHVNSLKPNHSFNQSYYCAWNNDEHSRRESTSGGVATAMALYAIRQGYYVAGAVFDEQWHLLHIVSSTQDGVDRMRGSKYLMSDTTSVYREVRNVLIGGGKLLFFGTPCQISALNAIIPAKLKDNLITCGIVCHGVNAPKVWEDFVHFLEEKQGSKLFSYNFRSKRKGWGKLQVEYAFANGEIVSQPAYKNLFHVWFGRHLMIREACLNCVFRTKERYSDITIGDFWGIEKLRPDLKSKEGVSVLIVSTNKGECFVSSIEQVTRIATDTGKTPQVLKGFLHLGVNTDKEIEQSKLFVQQYRTNSFLTMSKKYPIVTLMDRMLASLKYRLKL